MLIEEQRLRTVLTPGEVDQDLAEMIAGLSPDELTTLDKLLKDPDAMKVIEGIREIDYEWAPVGPREFLTDPFYFGNAAQNLYPRLTDDIEEIFLGNYEEVILSGSIGWGKTFMSSCILSYMLYQVSCLREPQRVYGIDESSFLTFACLSVSLKMARRGVFSEIVSKLENSPYFDENFKPKPTTFEVVFPKNVNVMAGSTSNNAIIGMNVFGGIIDEADFYGSTSAAATASRARWGIIDRVSLLYDAIKRRMKSRFMRVGKLPGILVIDSSATVQSSFTAQKMLEARTNSRIFVRDYSTFDVKPKHHFSGKKFSVAVGNEKIRSQIITEETNKKELDETGAKIFEVPEEYRDDFERNLDGAITDILGVSLIVSNLFLPNFSAVLECFEKGKGRQHPFTSDEWVCGREGEFVWDRLVRLRKQIVRGGFQETKWEPLVNPTRSRHAHLDLSKNGDATGLVVGHVDRYVEVPRRNLNTGEEYQELAPVIWIDFALRVWAPSGGEIVLGDVRSLLYEMRDRGFSFSFVSCDQYQSMDTIQKLRQRGIQSEVVSVDKKMDPYDTLKVALYERRVNCYPYQPLLDELSSLQKTIVGDRVKVDHPHDPKQGATMKDVADGMAAVVWSLTHKYQGETMLADQPMNEDKDTEDRLNLGTKLRPLKDVAQEAEVRLPFLTGGK